MESNTFYMSYMAAFEIPSSPTSVVQQASSFNVKPCRQFDGVSTTLSERISYLLPYASTEGVHKVLPAQTKNVIVKLWTLRRCFNTVIWRRYVIPCGGAKATALTWRRIFSENITKENRLMWWRVVVGHRVSSWDIVSRRETSRVVVRHRESSWDIVSRRETPWVVVRHRES